PAGDSAVSLEVIAQGTGQRDQGERYDGDSEDRMGSENREIDRANPALPLETHGADLQVIDDVGDQEYNGAGKGAEHARLMRLDAAGADEEIAERQQDRGGRVEDGVQGRSKGHSWRGPARRDYFFPSAESAGAFFLPPICLAMAMSGGRKI